MLLSFAKYNYAQHLQIRGVSLPLSTNSPIESNSVHGMRMSGSILPDNKNLVAIVTWALLDPVLPLARMFVEVALDAALERCLVLQEFPGR